MLNRGAFMPQFSRYIGLDYSGAAQPDSSQKGLRLYQALGNEKPTEIKPENLKNGRKHWSREGLYHWLFRELSKEEPALVGIDHGFSFPKAYFDAFKVDKEWGAFLAHFTPHWPTHEKGVQQVRDSSTCLYRQPQSKEITAKLYRLCEEPIKAKSVFHFGVQGAVAHSTHAGLPWLFMLRKALGNRLHFWPFDGWQVPEGKSVLAEVYPSLWSQAFEKPEEVTQDQHDAFVVAATLQHADRAKQLKAWFAPKLSPEHQKQARYEGWILGVTGESISRNEFS
jgi:hypothetical protein